MSNNQIENIHIHRQMNQVIHELESIDCFGQRRRVADMEIKFLLKKLAKNWEERDGKNKNH